MSNEGKSKVVRRKRAWWQWVLGLALLGAAGVLTVLNFITPGSDNQMRLVRPTRMSISPELEKTDVVPAAPGSLAGAKVLVVTYDTTRADHLGCYGYDRMQTPAADRLAEEGVLFSRAVTTSPTTLPSHCSLFTGLYPYHHGARANNAFRLDDRHTTMAEILSANDYTTAAFISAFVLDDQFGLDQGFGHYDDELEEVEEESPLVIAQRPANKTFEAAESWLRRHADEQFFLWVHFYDPHFPYEAPKPFSDEHKIPYDAEIAFTDFHFGKLEALLDELQISDETLVVMFGDHGEGLGQHTEMTHSCLIYDSVMHVPLIMRCGKKLGGGYHVDRPVSLVDVMPTVLSLLGIEGPDGMDGMDLTQPPDGDERALYMEAFQGLADYGWAALLGVQEGYTKYIHGPRVELYDLAEDPFERRDLAEADPRTEMMLASLEGFYGEDLEAASSVTATHQISAEDLEKLQALGYMGSLDNVPPPSARPHPKDMMPLLARMMQALALEKKESLDAAIARLENIAEEHPDFAAVHRHLGDLYRKRGDLDLAEFAYDQALQIQPTDVQPLLALASIKLEQRRVDDALELYRQVMARDPDHFIARLESGRLLLRLGEYRQAADVLEDALATRPDDSSVPDMLADALLVLKSDAEAVEIFEQHLADEPNLPMVRNALARVLHNQRRYAEAVAVLEEGIELAPDQRELVNNLCYMLVTCPDPAVRRPWDAIIWMERICTETGYQQPQYMHTLSMVYASARRVDEAIAMAEQARRVASRSTNPAYAGLVPQIGLSLQTYRDLKAQGVTASDIFNPPEGEEGKSAAPAASPGPDETPAEPSQ